MHEGESIFKNKKLAKALIALASVLSVLFFVRLINEISPNTTGYDEVNTITVEGEGEVTAVPDIAVINISIQKESTTADEATSMLDESIKAVLAYLSENGIEDKDIKSEYGGIQPKYEKERIYCVTYPCPQPQTKITGYTATQNIDIKIRVADNANSVRAGLAELGITNITGPTFSIEDEDLLQEEARALAIKDAKEKAKRLSKDLGVRFGKIVSFYEDGDRYYPMAYSKTSAMGLDMEMAMDEAPAVLPKGEDKVYSKVNITFRIK